VVADSLAGLGVSYDATAARVMLGQWTDLPPAVKEILRPHVHWGGVA
jgi:hypothetical protein